MNEHEPALDVERVSAGDADAWQRLILHCRGPLHGVVAAAIDAAPAPPWTTTRGPGPRTEEPTPLSLLASR